MNEKKQFSLEEQEYNLPQQEETLVDIKKQEVKDIRDLTPFEQMKIASEKYNLVLNEPNPNCKICYGRGYIGLNADKSPVPCTAKHCIFPEDKRKENGMLPTNFLNYKQKRKLKKTETRILKNKKLLVKNTKEINEEK